MFLGLPIGQSFYQINPATGQPCIDPATGKYVPMLPQQMCQTLIDGASTGQCMFYPLYAFKREDIIAKPELATTPGMKIDRFDHGNLGPMLEAGISRLTYRNGQIAMAYRRPPRESMEGKFGNRSESKAVSENVGIRDSEQIHQARCDEYTMQVGRTWKLANYGNDDDLPILRIIAAPLADQQQEYLQSVTNALIQDRNTGPITQTWINKQRLFKRTEVPLNTSEEQQQEEADLDEQNQQKQDAAQANNEPKIVAS